MGNKHAILSASSSHRWLACPPSALLCAKEKEEVSAYAKEGTDAHTLCEYYLKEKLGQNMRNPIENLDCYNEEMDNFSREYALFVLDKLASLKEYSKDPILLIEQKLDFSKWVDKGFGTGDAIIIADKKLVVIDFKYGQGILVNAKENPQMMCYALGAFDTFDFLYDIEEIEMIIFQPRKENISSDTISKEHLLEWAKSTLKPRADLAAKGEGDFNPGEHCQFCRVKSTCRKRAEENLKLARYDFKDPIFLEDMEIEEILSQTEKLVSWVNDVKEYALNKAMEGKKWKGFSLAEGRSIRKYTDEKIVANLVESSGFNPYEKKILGITAMTKLLGKERFNKMITPYIYKEKGKLILKEDKYGE